MVADGYYEPQWAAKFAQAVIGPRDDETARAICLDIAQTYGQTEIEDVVATADPSGDAGCALTIADGFYFPEGPQYVAYIRIAPRSQSYILPSNYP